MSADQAMAHVPSSGKISALGGPFIFKTNYEVTESSLGPAPLQAGLGLVVEGDLSPSGGLEVGMFYQDRIFYRHIGANYISEKIKLMYITMGYRWWLGSRFSAALAFFSSYSMGDPQIVHSDFIPADSVDTSARDTTEYGFDFSVQWEALALDRYSIILDARYSRSVTPKDHEDGDNFGVLVAAKYMLQGRISK